MRMYHAKPKKRIFGWVLLVYTAVLALIVTLCVMHVRDLLVEYEARQPERQIEKILDQLKKNSADEQAFSDEYSTETVTASEYEEHIDVLGEYLALFSHPDTTFALKPGGVSEDEMRYIIRCGDTELAEVLLCATTPLETKLAVFSMRDWEVENVTVGPFQKDYTVTLPSDFSLVVNGVFCDNGAPAGDGEVTYSLEGLYLTPDIDISDPDGRSADYVIRGQRILPEIYSYSLILPPSISVTLDSVLCMGTEREDGYISYSIRQLDKPDVVLSDLYGNSLHYEGGTVSMTNMTVVTGEGYSVTVNSAPIPEAAISYSLPEKYKIIEDTVSDLPMNLKYDVAVLQDDAVVEVTDADGDPVALKEDERYHDLTSLEVSDSIPDEIANDIDVLAVAKKWSLYMSNDCSFREISAYMLNGSYQYEVAYKYSTSVDRTFFSGHTLLDPAFTDTSVTNFVQITEDCFSVDIALVKHMRLNSNQYVDDAMNDSFYFVRSNGKWLLAAMQEVTDNA